MDRRKLIEELVTQLEAIKYRDNDALDALERKTEMYIRNIFSESSKYLDDLKRIHFSPMVYPASESSYLKSWLSGISSLKNLYRTMLDEILIFGMDSVETKKEKNVKDKKNDDKTKGKRIFIVHGHNNGIKSEVARFVEKLKLNPVILHERPNKGDTLIEKFERESFADFAIVLLTADDHGSEINSSDLKDRARQNVVLELGYFLGKIGRKNVAALVENGVEIPSDFSGVVYIPYDNADAWKLLLARELKEAQIDVDLNDVVT